MASEKPEPERIGEGAPKPAKSELLDLIRGFADKSPEQPRLTPSEKEDVADRQAERPMRAEAARRWSWVAIAQLAFMNILMAAVGAGCLNFSDWLINAYLIGTFGEIIAIVWLVMRYLFPTKKRI